MRKLTTCILILGCLLLASLSLIKDYLYSPLNEGREKFKLTILPGQNFSSVIKQFQDKGLLNHPRIFTLLVRLLDKEHQIKAGEFLIDPRWNRLQLLHQLTQGQEILYRLVIPEGLPWWKTAQLIENRGLASYSELRKAIFDQQLLEQFNIPAQNAEGYLFPQTYFFPHYAQNPGRRIISTLIRHALEGYKSLDPDSSPKKRHLILILASMVEKETAQPDERQLIAGVFSNRLHKKMLLQCDPTVIYGLGPGFNGNLTKKDLRDKKNPYNTYVYAGLPPGPICSPGLPSIQAALHPAGHNYLYFVSTGKGRHAFSKTLAQHLRLVRRYQKRAH